jgi:hypothetical protein
MLSTKARPLQYTRRRSFANKSFTESMRQHKFYKSWTTAFHLLAENEWSVTFQEFTSVVKALFNSGSYNDQINIQCNIALQPFKNTREEYQNADFHLLMDKYIKELLNSNCSTVALDNKAKKMFLLKDFANN